MRTIDIHVVETELSKLVEEAARGEPFIIAKDGRPLVQVISLGVPHNQEVQRFGFLKGTQFIVPDNFDDFARVEIQQMFEGEDDESAENK